MLYSQDELDALLMRLLGAGAVQIDLKHGFLLKQHVERPDARRSPIKINLSSPDVRPDGRLSKVDIERIAYFMWAYAYGNKLKFTGVAGVPNAGDALAEAFVRIAYQQTGEDVALLTLDKYEEGGKRHIGKLKKVTRYLPRGESVLVIDDVATKGESKEETVEQLRLEDYRVFNCLVFTDREQGARDSLELIGAKLHSVTTLRKMVSLYHQRNRIDGHVCDLLMEYMMIEV